MGDSPHNTRQTLLLIKEMLVDPLEKRLEASSDERREQHSEVMGKLTDLEARSLSAETAKRLRAMVADEAQVAMATGLSGRMGLLREVVRLPESKWIAAMLVMGAGLILMAIVFTGRSVHGVAGTPPATQASPKN